MVGRGRGGDVRCLTGDVEGCGFFDKDGSFGYIDERFSAYQTRYTPWLAVRMSWPGHNGLRWVHRGAVAGGAVVILYSQG